MPDIIDLNPGEYVVARVEYHHVNNPSKKFANVYEGVATVEYDGLGTLDSFADALGDFHQFVLGSHARITNVQISTYASEEGGYDPTSFVNFPTDRLGLRTDASEPLSAKCVVHIGKTVSTGRHGKAHLRLALFEADVEAPAGEFILSDQAGLQGLYDDALVDSLLADYFGGAGTDPGLRLTLVSAWGSPPVLGSRLVTGFQVAGVTVTPTDHKHFNRNG